MRINHNIASLNTYRQLSTNGANTQKSLEKLSSGLRINKAGDDAAGLAISEKMRGQIRGLDQASRNAQDGISLIQTAEGALNETHSILQRMRELAVQASSNVATDDDRNKIQSEADQLAKEITRISNTTEFNTSNLLAGGFSNKSILIGANGGQNIDFSISAIDAKSLGVASDVIKADAGTNDAGVKAATIRDGSAASTVAGQNITVTSAVHQADSAGEVKGLSSVGSLNDATAAVVTGTQDVSGFSATAAIKATVTGNGALNSAATVTSGALVDGDDDAVADGTTRFVFNVNGSAYNVDIEYDATGGGEYDQDTDTLNDLAGIIASKLSGLVGESVTGDFGVTTAGSFTFATAKTGADASLSITSITEDFGGTAADITSTYKLTQATGATVEDGHGTGSVNGAGYGKLALSIDGNEFSVDITENSTAADTVIAINTAANTALGTTGVSYASLNGGALEIKSDTSGANSSVKILGSYQTDGTTPGTLHQELGLSLAYDNATGSTAVGSNGTAGTVTFNVNGQQFDVTIEDGDDEAAVLTKINAASTAAIGGNIASLDGDDQIVFSSALATEGAATGSSANITVVGDDNSNRTLQALGLTVGTTHGKNDSAGILRLEIDGKAVNVDLTAAGDIDTAANIVNKINSDINAQLETSETYASVGANGKISIKSANTGSKSSVSILGDNTNGNTISGLGLQIEKKVGANTGELEYTATAGSKTETVNVKSDADIVVFNSAFNGLTLTKDSSSNTAGSAAIITSKEESSVATFTADGRIDDAAVVQKGILVDTVESADAAISKIDSAITTVSNQRSSLGALQNRLEHTIANLGTSSENLTAAESRIRDVDMAKEMMEFTKNNILSQAAQAMLAQANQQPQGVLQLLR